MKKSFLYIFTLFSTLGFSQDSISELLKKYNTEDIPYATIEYLNDSKSEIILLDARESKEYNVSHIKDAISVGFDNFNIATIEDLIPNKNQNIIVYCSLGVRSEVIAKKLKHAGYINVKNLFGGIFEWKNSNYFVYNSNEIKTDSIHAFSKAWSKWLKQGIKVYE